MEHKAEGHRLRQKTSRERVLDQAVWAGLKPGMRILDAGCGPGYTTSILAEVALTEGGEAVGLDASEERLEEARKNHPECQFVQKDIYGDLSSLGRFDFIWVRFFLEYHKSRTEQIIDSLTSLLNPGGILCLVDLDHNCLNHFGASPRLENALSRCILQLSEQADWDPYMGRRLYSFLYDREYCEIDVRLDAHHLIFGDLRPEDDYNWLKKLEVAVKRSHYRFPEYEDGYQGFFDEARAFFQDPRRFTYTPLLMCRGIKKSDCTD